MNSVEAKAAKRRVDDLVAAKKLEIRQAQERRNSERYTPEEKQRRQEVVARVNRKLQPLEKARKKAEKLLDRLYAQANRLVERDKALDEVSFRRYDRSNALKVSVGGVRSLEKEKSPQARQHALREFHSQILLILAVPDKHRRLGLDSFLAKAQVVIQAI